MKKISTIIAASSLLLLASCGGNTNSAGPADTGKDVVAALGAAIYKRTCVTCHQANGEGLPNTFPPLAKSDFLADREKTIGQVIKGYTGALTVNGKQYNSAMPPQQLNDQEVADVLTYVYGNFGNTGAAVTVDEVKAVRAKL